MNIRQHVMTMHTLHLILLCFLLGTAAVFVVGVLDTLQIAETFIRQNLKVVVLIQPAVADDAAKKWADGLLTQDPEIESVTFVSKAEALEKAQGNPALVKSLILLRENPLPSSVIIRYKDRVWLERPEPVAGIQPAPEIQEMRWDPEKRSTFQAIRQWRVWLLRIALLAVILLVVWTATGIYHALSVPPARVEVLVQLGAGFLGAGLALLVIGLSLQKVGGEAFLYKPHLNTPWPWITGLLTSVATLGWTVTDEK